jgi:hypothetical protein
MSPLVIISAYILFVLIFSGASFLALYQLWHFGYVGDASVRMLAIYLFIAGAIVVLTFLLYAILI